MRVEGEACFLRDRHEHLVIKVQQNRGFRSADLLFTLAGKEGK